MTSKVDEEEHSLELHLPYIKKVMEGASFTLIPILVGNLSVKMEAEFGKILSVYLDDPLNLFVISSDFCHWGKRFEFQHYDKKDGEIWQSIESLDKQGITLIESQDAKGFNEYLSKFHNTICGRHPIGILLQALQHTKTKFGVQLMHYSQSSQCKRHSDSSVSYVAAVASPSTTSTSSSFGIKKRSSEVLEET